MPGHRRHRALPPLLICLLLVNGCASMRHGRSQVVLVESEPPGARILVAGEPAGVTPNFVELARRGAVITLDKDGFLPEAIPVPRSLNEEVQGEATLVALLMLTAHPLAVGLSLLGLTLGTDLATGAAWKFPEEVRATLEPVRAGAKPASRSRDGAEGPSHHLRTTKEGE